MDKSLFRIADVTIQVFYELFTTHAKNLFGLFEVAGKNVIIPKLFNFRY